MNRKRFFTYAFLLLALFAANTLWLHAGRGTAPADATPQDTVKQEVADSNGYIVRDGDLAPDFTIRLTDGRTIRLSDLRGKVVLLQPTASWCAVCRREMPHLEAEIWQRHKDDPNFFMMGIDRDEPLEKVLRFVEQTGITYPMGLDPGADIYALYALRQSGITRNILIGRDGRIVMRTRLFNEEEFRKLVEKVDELLK